MFKEQFKFCNGLIKYKSHSHYGHAELLNKICMSVFCGQWSYNMPVLVLKLFVTAWPERTGIHTHGNEKPGPNALCHLRWVPFSSEQELLHAWSEMVCTSRWRRVSQKQAKRKKARSSLESGSMAASVLLAGQNTLIKQDGKMINDAERGNSFLHK